MSSAGEGDLKLIQTTSWLVFSEEKKKSLKKLKKTKKKEMDKDSSSSCASSYSNHVCTKVIRVFLLLLLDLSRFLSLSLKKKRKSGKKKY